MVAVLQQVGGGRIIAIDRAVVLVGRGADCDVVITASAKISRRHCCLVQVDKDYYLRDLGSMNGVWLNGARVNREAVMQSGDRVSIGDIEFLFHPNARIEQKKTAVAPVAQGAAAASSGQNARASSGVRPNQAAPASQTKPATKTAATSAKSRPVPNTPAPPASGRSSAVANNRGNGNARRPADPLKVVQADADSFEIIDDVIPLDESGIPMIGTNELEAMDDPIIDEDDLNATT